MSKSNGDGISARERRGIEKRRQQVRILGAWKASGLSQAAFCREREIPLSTFQLWKRSLSDEEAKRRSARKATARRKAEPKTFVPVRVVDEAPAATSSPIEIVVPNRFTIRVGGDFDPGVLRKVLAAVETPAC